MPKNKQSDPTLPPKKRRMSSGASRSVQSRDSNTEIKIEYPPEILADLAVKLVSLHANFPVGHLARPVLSEPHFDNIFADALKRAEMLLQSASGKSDNEVHAYQLFTKEDGAMSLKEIADRFKAMGWHSLNARATVKDLIEDLIKAANLEIRKQWEQYENLSHIKQVYPDGLYHVVDEVKNQIREVLLKSRLSSLLDSPSEMLDMLGQFFLTLMRRKVPTDWINDFTEEKISMLGFNLFIEYVCDGLSYEKFIGLSPPVFMNKDRLCCLIYFLQNIDSGHSVDSLKTDIFTLMRLTSEDADTSHEINNSLKIYLEKLKSPDIQMEEVFKLSSSICGVLRARYYSKYGDEKHSDWASPANFSVTCIENAKKSDQVKSFEGSLGGDIETLDLKAEDWEAPLNKLLEQLRPHKGERRCRPYELLLFAAQNNLYREKLVGRLSGIIPNPPYALKLSILNSHDGVKWD